jgi:hypothetical protein
MALYITRLLSSGSLQDSSLLPVDPQALKPPVAEFPELCQLAA